MYLKILHVHFKIKGKEFHIYEGNNICIAFTEHPIPDKHLFQMIIDNNVRCYTNSHESATTMKYKIAQYRAGYELVDDVDTITFVIPEI